MVMQICTSVTCFQVVMPRAYAKCCSVITLKIGFSDFDIGKHEADIVLAEQEMRPHEGQEAVVQLGEGEGSGKQVCMFMLF